MARLRTAPAREARIVATASRQALKEKTNTVRSRAAVIEDDIEDDDFVRDAPPKKGRPKKVKQNDADVSMAGGLGPAEAADQSAPPGEPPVTTDELAKSDERPVPNTKTNRRPPRTTRKMVQSEAQSLVLQDMKKRMQAIARTETNVKKAVATIRSDNSAPSSDALPTKPPPAPQPEQPATERSEFSLSPSPPPPAKQNKRSSLAQPGSALRSHGTPAVETSILALKNFKRRPRQPSMLQMVQQRTASARPSAAHVPAAEDDVVSDLEIGEDEDDFAPDAEGTPLHVSKTKSLAAKDAKKSLRAQGRQSAAPSSTTRKRKFYEAELSLRAVVDDLPTKRQKATRQQQDDDSQAKLSSGPSLSNRQSVSQPQVASDVLVINSSPSNTLPREVRAERNLSTDDPDVVVPSTENQQDDVRHDIENNAEQDLPNGTMAEPASSSPLPSLRATSVHQPDIMADPLTQISPQPKRDKAKDKTSKSKPMTTATLQSLLPKRRQPLQPRHRKSEYDIESGSDNEESLDTSHLEEDEDELGGRARRKTKPAAPSKGKRAVKSKIRARTSKAAPSTRKSTAPAPRKSTAKKPSKTYGRATASDKENEGDDNEDGVFEDLDENDASALPDTSISMIEALQSKELEEARRKFADVDDWDMSFESMSAEEGRSSSQNWR